MAKNSASNRLSFKEKTKVDDNMENHIVDILNQNFSNVESNTTSTLNTCVKKRDRSLRYRLRKRRSAFLQSDNSSENINLPDEFDKHICYENNKTNDNVQKNSDNIEINTNIEDFSSLNYKNDYNEKDFNCLIEHNNENINDDFIIKEYFEICNIDNFKSIKYASILRLFALKCSIYPDQTLNRKIKTNLYEEKYIDYKVLSPFMFNFLDFTLFEMNYYFQIILLFLHSQICQIPQTCLNPLCQSYQAIINHFKQCLNSDCKNIYCFTSRLVIFHIITCFYSKCCFCCYISIDIIEFLKKFIKIDKNENLIKLLKNNYFAPAITYDNIGLNLLDSINLVLRLFKEVFNIDQNNYIENINRFLSNIDRNKTVDDLFKFVDSRKIYKIFKNDCFYQHIQQFENDIYHYSINKDIYQQSIYLITQLLQFFNQIMIKVKFDPYLQLKKLISEISFIDNTIKVDDLAFKNPRDLSYGYENAFNFTPIELFNSKQLLDIFLPLIQDLYNSSEGYAFQSPVDTIYFMIFDYYDIISYPMDLYTIIIRLREHFYIDSWEVLHDTYQIFTNACTYNRKTTRVYKLAIRLKEIFIEKVENIAYKLGLCCFERRVLTPQPLFCMGKDYCVIQRDAPYYVYEKFYMFCINCFDNIKSDHVIIPIDDNDTKKTTDLNITDNNLNKITQNDDINKKSDILINEEMNKKSDILKNEEMNKKSDILKNEEMDKKSDILINEEINKQSDILKNEEMDKKSDILINEEMDKQSDILINEEMDKQSDILINEEMDKQSDIIKNEEINKQSDILINKKINKQSDIIKNEEINKQSDIIKNEEINKQSDIIKNEEINKQSDIIKNEEINKQSDILINKKINKKSDNRTRLVEKILFEKDINTKIFMENFIECRKCKKRVHKTCTLHINEIDGCYYYCDQCLLSMKKVNKINYYTSKNLLETNMSVFIESSVNAMLLKKLGKNEQPVIIRMIYNNSSLVKTLPVILEYFKDKYALEFPYRSKALFAFQKLNDGSEICFFGMHVQEYGNDAPEPNKRRAYLSYLDSVHFFQPKELKTDVYYHILASYFDFIRLRGFSYVHLWACPPCDGDDYIFHCHPEAQKIPKHKRLVEWYKKLLDDCVKSKIFSNIKDLQKYIYKEKRAEISSIPYFEGDYWPIAFEDIINEVKSELNVDSQIKNITNQNFFNSKSRNIDRRLMFMQNYDNNNQNLENIKNKLNLSDVVKNNKKKRTIKKNKGIQMKVSISNKGDNLNEFLTVEQRLFNLLNRFKDIFFVCKLNTNLNYCIDEPDTVIHCDLTDGRSGLLQLCRERKWEFSTLLRTKFATLGILVELHIQFGDRFIYTCNICKKHLFDKYHCNDCVDFDLCARCYFEDGHEHEMKFIDISYLNKINPSNILLSQNISNVKLNETLLKKYVSPLSDKKTFVNKPRSLQNHIESKEFYDLMLHCSICPITNTSQICPENPKCQRMRLAIIHCNSCKFQNKLSCPICYSLMTICIPHARTCRSLNCKVVFCKQIRERIGNQQTFMKYKQHFPNRTVGSNMNMQRRMSQMHQSDFMNLDSNSQINSSVSNNIQNNLSSNNQSINLNIIPANNLMEHQLGINSVNCGDKVFSTYVRQPLNFQTSTNISDISFSNSNLNSNSNSNLNSNLNSNSNSILNISMNNLPMNNLQMNNLQMNNLQMNNLQMNNLQMNSLPINNLQINNNLPMNSLPINNLLMNNLQMNNLPMNNLPMNNLPMNNLPMNNLPMNNLPMNNLPMNNLLMNNSQMNNLPMNNLPMNNLPMNNLPINDLLMDNFQNNNLNDVSTGNNRRFGDRNQPILEHIKIIPQQINETSLRSSSVSSQTQNRSNSPNINRHIAQKQLNLNDFKNLGKDMKKPRKSLKYMKDISGMLDPKCNPMISLEEILDLNLVQLKRYIDNEKMAQSHKNGIISYLKVFPYAMGHLNDKQQSIVIDLIEKKLTSVDLSEIEKGIIMFLYRNKTDDIISKLNTDNEQLYKNLEELNNLSTESKSKPQKNLMKILSGLSKQKIIDFFDGFKILDSENINLKKLTLQSVNQDLKNESILNSENENIDETLLQLPLSKEEETLKILEKNFGTTYILDKKINNSENLKNNYDYLFEAIHLNKMDYLKKTESSPSYWSKFIKKYVDKDNDNNIDKNISSTYTYFTDQY